MRRRSSGSAAEEEGDDSATNEVLNPTVESPGGRIKDSTFVNDSTSLSTTTRPPIPIAQNPPELDRRKSTDKRPTARSRRPSNTNWKPSESESLVRNGQIEKGRSTVITVPSKEAIAADKMPESQQNVRRSRLRSPWSCSALTLVTTSLATICLFAIIHSFLSRQLDTKGCRMSYMRPSFAKLSDFDTEHTRFASKYSVYLYREGMVDEDTKVWEPEPMGRDNTNWRFHRSKAFLFFSYLGMLAVTSRFGPSLQRLPFISMMSYGTILLQSTLALETWTSLQ
jgi:glycosylphosphatidylinositol deacylase